MVQYYNVQDVHIKLDQYFVDIDDGYVDMTTPQDSILRSIIIYNLLLLLLLLVL